MAFDLERITGVHPFADLFPMLDAEDLQALADDIAENGQSDPALIDKNGLLIDGRNRRAACELAGIELRIEVYDGDPLALIVSKNLHRRSLSKGQRAMLTAMAYPQGKLGRKRTDEKSVKITDFSASYLVHARFVLAHTPAAAQEVATGERALADAYSDAIQVRDRTAAEKGRMDRLKAAAPDLAAEVSEASITLAQAEAKLRQRQAEEEAQADSRMLAGRDIEEVLERAENFVSPNLERLAEGLADPVRRADYMRSITSLAPERLAAAKVSLTALLEMLEGLDL